MSKGDEKKIGKKSGQQVIKLKPKEKAPSPIKKKIGEVKEKKEETPKKINRLGKRNSQIQEDEQKESKNKRKSPHRRTSISTKTMTKYKYKYTYKYNNKYKYKYTHKHIYKYKYE